MAENSCVGASFDRAALDRAIPLIPTRSERLIKKVRNVGCALVAGSTMLSGLVYTAYNLTEGHYGLNAELPDVPPDAVLEQVDDAVYLEGRFPTRKEVSEGKVSYEDWSGARLSGVSLGNGWYLTAGHGLLDDNSKPVSPLECANYMVHGISESGNPYQIMPRQVSVASEEIAKDYAMFRGPEPASDPVSYYGQPALAPPAMEIADEVPAEGEVVYFVNWEPAADGTERKPRNDKPGYNQPAIFAGIVRQKEAGYINVATGLKSYGEGVPEDRLRPGGSGGLVLNAKGELVGLSNARQEHIGFYGLLRTAIGPLGVPGDGSEAVVTIIDDTIVDHLKAETLKADQCSFVDQP